MPKNQFFVIPSHPQPTSEIVLDGPDLLESIANYSDNGEAYLETIENNRDETAEIQKSWARTKFMWEELTYHEPIPEFGVNPGAGGDDEEELGEVLATDLGTGGIQVDVGLTGEQDELKELLGGVEGFPLVRRHLAAELDELDGIQLKLLDLIKQWVAANIKFQNSGWSPDALIPEPLTETESLLGQSFGDGDPLPASTKVATQLPEEEGGGSKRPLTTPATLW